MGDTTCQQPSTQQIPHMNQQWQWIQNKPRGSLGSVGVGRSHQNITRCSLASYSLQRHEQEQGARPTSARASAADTSMVVQGGPKHKPCPINCGHTYFFLNITCPFTCLLRKTSCHLFAPAKHHYELMESPEISMSEIHGLK